MHQNIPVSVSQISYSCVKVANSGTGNPNISLKLLTKKVVAYIAYNKSAFQNLLRWIELKISKKYLGKQNSKKKKITVRIRTEMILRVAKLRKL